MGLASTATPAAADYTPTADLGNVMYVGDSITHGYGAASYRWALLKILTDNGISQNEVGVATGNQKNGMAAGTKYGTATFENVHSSWSSERAYEIAGRKNTSGRLGNSNILDWLGLDATYDGTYTIDAESEMPDTFFLLIGTNALLSDTGSNKHVSQQNGAYFSTVQQNLIGLQTQYNSETQAWEEVGWVDTTAASSEHRPDMDVIVDAMSSANPNANIVVTTIPVWSSSHSNNNDAADYSLIAQYNENLKRWAERKNEAGANITLVDVNAGLIDVANTEKPGSAQGSMFYDGLHPSYHGDLIIAGNIAQALGYAGRTAGQERRAAADFSIQLDAQGSLLAAGDSSLISLADGATLSYSWAEGTDLSNGFTVDFSLANGLGNGATDGWNTTDVFSVSLGDGTTGGTLNISEAYIKWGDTLLYSIDTSMLGTAADDALRVAYVNGNSLKGLNGGYYVWMGDKLIGEALASSASTLSGLSITNGTGSSVVLDHLSLDNSSWAPTTERYVNPENPNPLIASLGGDVVAGPGTTWTETIESQTGSLQDSTVQNKTNAAWVGSSTSVGDVNIVVDGGTTPVGRYITAASSGAHTGDVYVTMTGTHVRNAGNGYNSVHDTGAHVGSVAMRFDSKFKSDNNWIAFFGVSNGSVTKDVYLEFSSGYMNAGGGTYNVVSTSIAGTYKANVGGNINVVLNAGSFGNTIYGGEVGGNGYTIGGNVNIYVNNANVGGDVYGGGVYGTISGDTAVHVTGEASLSGTLISGGGKGGVISGNSLVSISDVDADSDFATSFKGTLCGGTNVGKTRTLAFNNVKGLNVAAIQNFDVISVDGDSVVELANQTVVKELNTGATSEVTLKGGEYTELHLGNSGTLKLTQGVSVQVSSVADDNLSGTIDIKDGSTFDAGGASMYASTAKMESGTLKNYDGQVAINATGNVTLSGVDASQITQLNTLSACQVSGISGNLTLDEAKLALGEDSNTFNGAALVVDSGTITITESLTLNLDGTLSDMLVAQLPGQQAAPLSITMTGGVDTSAQSLIVANGKLDVDVSRVNITLAEGYVGYVVKATGVEYDAEENVTRVTYELSAAAVPEPTTATLSLLALAALAARRRRRA